MNLKPLVDGDILLYEIGYGAETGWKGLTNDPEALPPWWYVEQMLHLRLDNIKAMVQTNEEPTIYVTDGPTFRYKIATTKPYKGTRKEAKPWHYSNLKAYILGCLNSERVQDVEADDMMAITHTASGGKTIICSRDKDLKQVPGWLYSWELGHQPQFGPTLIETEGTLELSDQKKLTGTGLRYFFSQVLTGDVTDNIPGLEGCGAVGAFNTLKPLPYAHLLLPVVEKAYADKYGKEVGVQRLIEQGQLCWIVRRLLPTGKPELWYPGLQY